MVFYMVAKRGLPGRDSSPSPASSRKSSSGRRWSGRRWTSQGTTLGILGTGTATGTRPCSRNHCATCWKGECAGEPFRRNRAGKVNTAGTGNWVAWACAHAVGIRPEVSTSEALGTRLLWLHPRDGNPQGIHRGASAPLVSGTCWTGSTLATDNSASTTSQGNLREHDQCRSRGEFVCVHACALACTALTYCVQESRSDGNAR